MPKLFGIDIAGLVGKQLGKSLLPLTLTKVTAGTPTAGSLTGGSNPTTADSAARGILDDYRAVQIDGELIQRGDRKVLILGATITPAVVPEPGDRVTIEGATFNVVRVERDPAAATYTCQVRGVGP